MLNDNMMNELATLRAFDQNPAINVIVLTGSEKVPRRRRRYRRHAVRYQGNLRPTILAATEHILDIRKPVIGVVSGYCLGGG
jgi:enoyl-CoA hydratase